MKQNNIIKLYVIFLFILVLIPYLFWAKNYNINLVSFTEEWYKSIVNLIILFIGYVIFDYSIKNSEKRKTDITTTKIKNKMINISNEITSIIDSNSAISSSLKQDIELYVFLINYIKANSIQYIDNDFFIKCSFRFTKSVKNSFESLLDEDINIDVKKKSLKVLKKYLNIINTTSNIV